MAFDYLKGTIDFHTAPRHDSHSAAVAINVLRLVDRILVPTDIKKRLLGALAEWL